MKPPVAPHAADGQSVSLIDLSFVKIFAVSVLSVFSAAGVLAPFFYYRCRSRRKGKPNGNSDTNGTGQTAGANGNIMTGRNTMALSLANNFSAGMLLGMALLHFFPEAMENGGSPKTMSVWMLIGVLIPAIIERCASGEGAASGAHGHSHAHVSYNNGSDGVGGAGAKSGSSSSNGSFFTLLALLMCVHSITEGILLGFEKSVSALRVSAIPLTIHRFFDGLVIGIALAKDMQREVEVQEGQLRLFRRVNASPPDHHHHVEVAVYGATDACMSGGLDTRQEVQPLSSRPGTSSSCSTNSCSMGIAPVGQTHAVLEACSIESNAACADMSLKENTTSSIAAFERRMSSTTVWSVLSSTSVTLWLLATPLTMLLVIIGSFLWSGGPHESNHGTPGGMWLDAAQSVGSGSFVYIALVDIVAREGSSGIRGGIAIFIGAAFVELLIHMH